MAKIDDSVKKKVPELRFKGFTDEWEDRKFFESIASTIDFRGRTPKKLGMDWSESGYLALSALNVKNGYIDPLADAHYGDENLYKKWMSGKELKKGQVLFTTEAPMGNVAQVPDNNGYILSQRTVAFETKEDMMTNDFLAVLLKSPLVFNNLSALSSGGTAKGVSQKSLKGLSITVPFDIDEQQKIGSFFKQLDDTIALHQRKLDLLKEQKKGYLQKMFPKNGAKVPELRFAGFADDWEDRKFFESIASTIDFRGRTPKKLGMDWSESGYLALSALNVKNGYIDPLADAHYGDENLYKKWMSGKELKKGQVLFTTEAPMGNVAQVPDNNGYILSQRTVAFETKEDMMTNDFLAVLLKSPLVFNNLSALSSGGTAKGVSQKSLKGLSITVPFDIDEQQKIGSFFKQLDDTIALHQRKLDLLKEQKKGFLQKMFV